MRRVFVVALSCVAMLSIFATPSKASTNGGGDGLPCDTFDETPTYADLVYGEPLPGAQLKLDVWVPPGTSQFPNVVLIHGAFGSGDKTAYDSWAESICHQGFVVYNINYRLECLPGQPPNEFVDPAMCTAAKYPDEPNDAATAVEWVRTNAATYKGDPDVVAVMGASGGGALAAIIGSKYTGIDRPEAVISWSGMLKLWVFKNSADPDRIQDATERYTGCPYSGVGSCPEIWVEASPVTWVTSDDPPMYLANGKGEIISFNQTLAMDKKLTGRGVDHLTRIVPLPLHGRQYENYFIPSVGMTVQEETFQWMHEHLDPLVCC